MLFCTVLTIATNFINSISPDIITVNYSQVLGPAFLIEAFTYVGSSSNSSNWWMSSWKNSQKPQDKAYSSI